MWNISVVTSRTSATAAPRPTPGKMNTLLAWPITCRLPSYSTSANGLPVATMALPRDQVMACSGVHSERLVGLLRGRMIGRFTCWAMVSIISWVKVLARAVAPTKIVGFTATDHVLRRELCVGVEAVLGHDFARECQLPFVRLVHLPPVVEQTVAIEGHDGAADMGLVGAVGAHGDGAQPRDAGTRRARADEHDALLAHALPGEAQTRQNTRDADAGGALDVVVERRNAPPIALQQGEGAILVKILPLQNGAGKHLANAAHERFDEVFVLSTAQALLRVAEVEWVREQVGIIRAHVQADGQALGGVDPRAGHVQRQLADGNAHAATALIAQAEDALVVRRDDQANVAKRRVSEHVRDVVHVVWREPQAARRTIDMGELLTRLTHRGRVHDGHQLRDVIDQHPIEQHLVAIVQARQADVLLERRALGADLIDGRRGLLVQRRDAVGHHAAHAAARPAFRD